MLSRQIRKMPPKISKQYLTKKNQNSEVHGQSGDKRTHAPHRRQDEAEKSRQVPKADGSNYE